MSSRTAAASRRQHNEKNQQLLKKLVKEESNKFCADCKTASHPRWASWNLGCFICIRCSGIHRSMGTHISKVKSIDLDSWTDEQIESMIKWGNAKSNWYWESKLPAKYTPDDSKIENFIRTKYDLKKWIASPSVPNPLTIQLSSSLDTPAPSIQQKPAAPIQPQPTEIDLFSVQEPAVKPAPSQPPASFLDLTPKPKLQSSTTSTARNNPLPSLPNESNSSVNSANSTGSRPDLKKSILSLYSSSNSSFQNPQQPTNHLVNGFNNMNLGNNSHQYNNSSNVVSSVPVQPAVQPIASNQWTNSSSPASNNGNGQWMSYNKDDDLFKNVWS